MTDDNIQELTEADVAANMAQYRTEYEESVFSDNWQDDGGTVVTGLKVQYGSDSSSGFSAPAEDPGFKSDGGDDLDDSISVRAGRRGASYGGFAQAHVKVLRDTAEREILAHAYKGRAIFKTGRPPVSWPGREQKPVAQRVFQIEGVREIFSPEQRSAFASAFATECMHTNLVMPTGAGKTTSVPAEIAAQSGKRVLVLIPTYHLVRYAVTGLSRFVPSSSSFLREIAVGVTVMTYADFYWRAAFGHKAIGGYFDVVYIDESHNSSAYAAVVRGIIATRFPQVSVVLATATRSGGDSLKEMRNVIVEETERDMTLEELIESGLLSGEFARDRTALLLPDDYQVYRFRDILEQLGYYVHMLDSASTGEDVAKLREVMRDSSGVPRFIVMLWTYGESYDIPITHIISCGYKRVYVDDGDRMKQVNIHFTEAQREQQAGRVGRFMSGRNTATFLSTKRGKVQQIDEEDRVLAWLLLKMAGINPLPSILPNSEKYFAGNVGQETAYNIVSTMLPPALVRRYIAADGFVAAQFIDAFGLFSYSNHTVRMSKCESVVDSLWVKELIGDYLGEGKVGSQHKLAVPFVTDGPLKVVMHAIAAHSTSLVRLRKPELPHAKDADRSDDELRPPRRVVPRTLRAKGVGRDESAPVKKPLPPTPPGARARPGHGRGSPPTARMPRGPGESGRRRSSEVEYVRSPPASVVSGRVQHIPPSATFEDESPIMPSIDRWMDNMSITSAGTNPVEPQVQGDMVRIYRRRGAAEFVAIELSLYETIELGRTLSREQYGQFLRALGSDVRFLARCAIFDNWSNAWLGILETMVPDNIKPLRTMERNCSMELLERLWKRHVREFAEVQRDSAKVERMRDRLFSSGSPSSGAMRVKTGSHRKTVSRSDVEYGDASRKKKELVQVAQSSVVKDKMTAIRRLFVRALGAHEDAGLARPSLRTAMIASG